MVDVLIADYNEAHPENSLSGLTVLYNALQAMPGSYWRNKKMNEAKQLIIECCGIYTEAVTEEEFTVPGEPFAIQFNVIKRLPVPVILKSIKLAGKDSLLNINLQNNVFTFFSKTLTADSIS